MELGQMEQAFVEHIRSLPPAERRRSLRRTLDIVPHVACVIPGFRNERQVACNLGAVQRELSAADWALIDQVLKG